MLNLENLTTFELGIEILIGLMAVSLIVAFVRFFLGPDVPDRTVAFDLIAIRRGHHRLDRYAHRQNRPMTAPWSSRYWASWHGDAGVTGSSRTPRELTWILRYTKRIVLSGLRWHAFHDRQFHRRAAPP
ncbi:MAG: hypothetical protein R2856_32555 [Caldilineaceae bacterium]